MRRTALLWGALAFGGLVLLNTGGYRYGVSDQAFYIPVVLRQLNPTLYPHDAALLAAQDRFFAFDDWFAPILARTGLTLPTAFLIAYVTTLALFYAAVIGIGRALSCSWWTVAGLIAGLTMRHRIPDTAVNSLEGYFHPRVLAFALGLGAIGIFLRGRTWPSLAVAALALFVHPTTALWILLLVGVAALVGDPPQRRRLLVAAAGAGLTVSALLIGPLRARLVIMNKSWVEVLSVKDYLNSMDWPVSTWIANLGLIAVIAAVYACRRRRGLVTRRETGLVLGGASLVGLFLASVPLADAHVALIVQLQFNRVFWVLDVLAHVYMAWLLIEAAFPPRCAGWLPAVRRVPRVAVVVVVGVLALARGSYVTFVDPTGRPISPHREVIDDWNRIMAWARVQPIGTHFLADPAHANVYGTSIRVGGERDVYLEVVKDVGMAIYSAEIADRVSRRLDDLGHFAELDAPRARALARRYAIDFLITEKTLDLPEATRAGRLHVYDLGRLEP